MKIRVLIVDDAAFVRDAFKRAIRRFLRDVDIFDANNGHRALSTLKTNKIDLIICEWDMDEMSGHELLQQIRGTEKYAKTPFIVTSEEGDRTLVMNAINAGANDFMAKPFSPEEVQKKVVKQLARIGLKPKGVTATNQSENSLNVLTGGGSKRPSKDSSPQVVAAADFGGKTVKKKPSKKSASKGSAFEGQAQLVIGHFSSSSVINELSLTSVHVLLERPQKGALPQLFDMGKTRLLNKSGEVIGELKIYVHGMQSCDPRPDASALKMTLRFVDNDPEAFEQLSKSIARGY